LLDQLRQYGVSTQPTAGGDAQDEITSSARRSSVAIDEWMNVI
jgi:hypothetical protein